MGVFRFADGPSATESGSPVSRTTFLAARSQSGGTGVARAGFGIPRGIIFFFAQARRPGESLHQPEVQRFVDRQPRLLFGGFAAYGQIRVELTPALTDAPKQPPVGIIQLGPVEPPWVAWLSFFTSAARKSSRPMASRVFVRGLGFAAIATPPMLWQPGPRQGGMSSAMRPVHYSCSIPDNDFCRQCVYPAASYANPAGFDASDTRWRR
jgi:hypothetical protein